MTQRKYQTGTTRRKYQPAALPNAATVQAQMQDTRLFIKITGALLRNFDQRLNMLAHLEQLYHHQQPNKESQK